MLRLRSLRTRAALWFMAVYALIFLGGFLLLAWQSLTTGGERHHAGPTIALGFAADEMRLGPDRLVFPEDGRFLQLAEKNPALWVLVADKTRLLAFGSVPDSARTLVSDYADVLEVGRLHAPGVARPLSDMSALRRGDLLLAAGGVDPATITLADVLHHTMREGLLPILLAFGLLGLIAMLASLPLLTGALKPLVSGAAATSPLHPERRISEAKVPLELLPLVRSFNAALDRVADELVRRKRFVADVAHELKTPLAILSLQVDELPDDERKPEIQRVLSRMAQMVAQMLDVERLSHAGTPRIDVDLAALARDVAADMAPLAVAAGYEVSVDAPATPVNVQGDPHALARALANLVGNAIAHAGGRGAIQVRVSAEREVDVIDSGPGVPVAIRPQLFEPFSRARWDRDGCGMGLHLTREVMRAHGGDAELLPTSAGAHFRLSFPRAGLAPPPCARS